MVEASSQYIERAMRAIYTVASYSTGLANKVEFLLQSFSA